MRYFGSMVIAFSLFALTAYAQDPAEEKFPKAGCVKNDGAIVRAGDNINYENLCALSKAETVKIIGKRYSWYKILLPRKACLYISRDYVDLTSDEKGVGIVKAVNVNLRAGPGTKYTIVGQISKPEKVSVLSEDTGWYKIEPPYGTAGWIHSGQITESEESEITAPQQKEAPNQPASKKKSKNR